MAIFPNECVRRGSFIVAVVLHANSIFRYTQSGMHRPPPDGFSSVTLPSILRSSQQPAVLELNDTFLESNYSSYQQAKESTKLLSKNELSRPVKVPKFDKEKISRKELWKKKSLWALVSPDAYQKTVFKAHQAMDPLVKQVYTDCRMIVSPSSNDTFIVNRYSLVQFECGDGSLQSQPCHTEANLCLVVPSKLLTNDETIEYSNNKTALLMLVDSMDYLLYNTNNDFAWKSFLNKAAYAYQSQRPLFIWIGRLADEKHVLNGREDQAVYEGFGAACDPNHHGKPGNSMHYYKPIAFATLFHKQTLIKNVQTAFFLDADISFTDEAFSRIGPNINATDYGSNNGKLVPKTPMGPEDYFEISPQASLWGSQNTKGQIVMNGGLLGLRNTTWLHDFSALWWFTRCGQKDQRGLWLVLFATWSAATAKDSGSLDSNYQQFAYPGVIFLTYQFGFSNALPHFRKYFRRIQKSWNIHKIGGTKRGTQNNTISFDVEMRYTGSGNSTSDLSFRPFQIPTPTNTTLYDGGKWETRYKRPLEMPHVLLLPLTSYVHHKRNGQQLDLPGLKADIANEDRQPFVVHSKKYQEVCTNQKCSPFVVEG